MRNALSKAENVIIPAYSRSGMSNVPKKMFLANFSSLG